MMEGYSDEWTHIFSIKMNMLIFLIKKMLIKNTKHFFLNNLQIKRLSNAYIYLISNVSAETLTPDWMIPSGLTGHQQRYRHST